MFLKFDKATLGFLKSVILLWIPRLGPQGVWAAPLVPCRNYGDARKQRNLDSIPDCSDAASQRGPPRFGETQLTAGSTLVHP